MFDGIKNKIGHSVLKKTPIARRNAVVSNYHEAKSVGVIYLAENEGQFVIVKQFIKHLKSEYGIRKVVALAVIDDKEVPSYFLRGVNQDFINDKDLNWYKKPEGKSYDAFVNEHFDILIDFSNGENLPLKFLQKESIAGFKVGKAGSGSQEQYDLLIAVNKENTFDEYIKKINLILDSINRVKKEPVYA